MPPLCDHPVAEFQAVLSSVLFPDHEAVRLHASYINLEKPPFVSSPDWLLLSLTGYPDFATWQPF